MLSKRRNLENYAQNVLRAQLCKAMGKQYSNLAIGITFLLASVVTVFAWVAWRESAVAIDLALYVIGFSLMGVWSLYQSRYWLRVEQTIRGKISEIMAELRQPGEPERDPDHFAIKAFDSGEFSKSLLRLFKEEPLLVFPQPDAV